MLVMVRYFPTNGRRFYVIGIHGYRISPAKASPGKLPSTAFAVLDASNMHREVAIFDPYQWDVRAAEKKARALAARLNAEEKAA